MDFLRSRFFEPIAVTLLVPLVATLFLCCSPALVSQTKAAASPSIPQNSLPGFDPTKPETQPSLTVNRDPVPSPDEAAEATSKSSSTAEQGTAIQKNKSGIYTLRENVNEVILNCTVVDENGELVKGLAQRDFRVWEDGVPQTIQSFQYQDLPVSMGILVDNSGSMRDKRSAVDKAALDLVRASNPHDEAFIVNFSDKAYLDQGFTSKLVALEKGLSRFDAGNMTALYDAVAASADELSKYGTHPKEVLLIITDGADNASQLTLAEAVRRVQYLGGPVVYSIGLLYDDSPQEAQKAKSDLEELSADTGGIAYFPSSVDQVNEVAEQVASDIRHQYTIGYRSTKPASLGGFRTVRVEATAPHYKKLIVRTRKGYYPGQRPGQAPARPQQVAQTAK
jgi:VWFA-related protein